MEQEAQFNKGEITAIRGSVVDARFPAGLPGLNHLLFVKEPDVKIEVFSQLSKDTVRGIAFTPTLMLSRGSPIYDTGKTVSVPVGPGVLGRIFDVFGKPIDSKGPVDAA